MLQTKVAIVKDNKDWEEKLLDIVQEAITIKEKYDDLEKSFSVIEKWTLLKIKSFWVLLKKLLMK